MLLRRFVILSVFLMMLAAAPVWGKTAAFETHPKDAAHYNGSCDGGPVVVQIIGVKPVGTTGIETGD